MLEHICFCFCICCITCIQILSDSICFIYHLGEFFVSIEQSFCCFCFFYFVDVRILIRIVSVVFAVSHLTEVVLWVSVVSTPTVVGDRMQMWDNYFVTNTLNVCLDVEFYIVIAEAVREHLCNNVCAVQSGLAGCLDVVVNFNWEGNALSSQLFNCLLFVLFCFFSIQSYRCLAIFFSQTQLCSYQIGVVCTIRSINQTFHGVEVVFTAHWVDCVYTFPVVCEVQTIVPGQTECFVCNCSVPVCIWCAIFFHLVVVKDVLIRVFRWNIWNQIIMEFVVRVFCNCIQLSFTKLYIVNVAGFIQLVCNVVGLYHLNSNGIEQFCFSIPVHWVFGEDLFVTLNVRGHGVATIVPHIFVVHGTNSVRTAQLIYHCLRHWVQTNIGSQGIEVWFFGYTVINYSVIIWSFQTNHFTEFRTFACCQSFCFFFRQGLGVFIIFGCAFDHFDWHGCIGRVIFVEVQNPLQTSCEVLCITICFFLTVHVNPFYTFTEFEGPAQTAVFCTPLFCDTWNELTFCVRFQQTINQVCQVFSVFQSLAVEDVKSFQFSGSNSWND